MLSRSWLTGSTRPSSRTWSLLTAFRHASLLQIPLLILWWDSATPSAAVALALQLDLLAQWPPGIICVRLRDRVLEFHEPP